MKRMNKWNVIAAVSIILLLLIILEEAITTNKTTAPISQAEQEKAITISEEFLAEELGKVREYRVYVGKIGKYYYPEGKKKKVLEVTFTFDSKNIGTLVDITDGKIVQVSKSESYYWLKERLN